jgi:transcriptional regulator with XRE-family HTH domain
MIDADLVLQRRTLAGLSQRRLAKLVGVNAMTIQRLEHGADTSDLPLAVLGRLADALDLEPADLLRPRTPPSPADEQTPEVTIDSEPLDHNAAKLLRRVHRGEDVRRHLSQVDREITLPRLVNRGLVEVHASGLGLAEPVLAPPHQLEHFIADGGSRD